METRFLLRRREKLVTRGEMCNMPRLFSVAEGLDGNGKKKTSICLGDEISGIQIRAGGWNGIASVEVYVVKNIDYVKISLGPYVNMGPKETLVLYDGPINYELTGERND